MPRPTAGEARSQRRTNLQNRTRAWAAIEAMSADTTARHGIAAAPSARQSKLMRFSDNFAGRQLDPETWLANYLPAWSSRTATAATYELAPEELRLFIPPAAGLWCEAHHKTPLRVSGIQSGNRSGPVGSHDGQQRFAHDIIVREFQPTFRGWLPTAGQVSIRCRMELSARSMAAMWLSGFEERPTDAGELCVVEVFGRSVAADGSAEIGVGVKALYDPRLTQDFVAPRLDVDVSDFHTYSVAWGQGVSSFIIDGKVVHSSPQSPDYPMQLMVAVFDFPDWSSGADHGHVPALVVGRIDGDVVI